MDNNKKGNVTKNPEDNNQEIKKNIKKSTKKGHYNFLINASNQGSLTHSYNTSPLQVNALFVLVSPYYIEKFNLEGLDLDIMMDSKGTILINNEKFSTLEIEPGIRAFGLSKEQ